MAGVLKESKDYIIKSLGSISLTELKRLQNDEEFEEDTRQTSQPYVRMCKYKDGIEDATLKLAKDNLSSVEHLEGDLQVYQETVHPLYAENCEKVKGLLETTEAKQRIYSKENAIKVLK